MSSKISDVIKILEDAKKKHGDLTVCVWNDYFNVYPRFSGCHNETKYGYQSRQNWVEKEIIVLDFAGNNIDTV